MRQRRQKVKRMKKVDLSSLNIEDYVNSIDIKKIKDTLSDSKYKRIIQESRSIYWKKGHYRRLDQKQP